MAYDEEAIDILIGSNEAIDVVIGGTDAQGSHPGNCSSLACAQFNATQVRLNDNH